MRFAIISPAAGLQKFATLSSTHLILPQVENEVYWRFYEELSKDPTQLIILDNGAYEGQMNMDNVFKRLKQLKPSCLVLPDLFNQVAEKTYSLAVEFIKEYRADLPTELMYCPQFDGSPVDFQELKNSISSMYNDFGINWFGIPRIIGELGYSRANLVRAIKEMAPEVYVHALGMVRGSLKEFQELTEAGADSCDSSAPVWRGWNGYDIEAGEAWKAHGVPCNFDADPSSLTTENESRIRRNLKKVGVTL